MMSEPISQRIGKAIAKWWGWQIVMDVLPPPKCVIIAAHHTSTWDVPLALIYIAASNLPLNWVMKDTMFWGPLGWLWKPLGGIPVNRRVRGSFVEKMADEFRTRETFMMIITPEGTRGYTNKWKSGFYYIAVEAGVPIMLGFVDFKRKAMGIGGMLTPSGNIAADIEIIRQFYSTVTGKYPERHGVIQIDLPPKILDADERG